MFTPLCVTDISSHGIGKRGYGGGASVDGGGTGSVHGYYEPLIRVGIFIGAISRCISIKAKSSLGSGLVSVCVNLLEFPCDVRQPRCHHLPRSVVRSQIPPIQVWQCRCPQIVHQPFIFRPIDCLSVQRQEVFMLPCFCQRFIDNITYTVLAQCIVDVKCYSLSAITPPMLLLMVAQSGSVLPVDPACVTTITHPGGRLGEVSTSPTL